MRSGSGDDAATSRTPDVDALHALRKQVAELQQSEAALRAQVATLSELQDGLPDLIVVTGKDRRILFANKAFCEFYGLPREQIVGATEDSFVMDDIAKAHAEQDEGVLSTGMFVAIPSEPLRRNDGIELHFQTFRCPIRDAAGNVVKVISSSRPIHVGGAVEKPAAKHNEVLLSIIPDMYFRIGRDGTFIDFSAAKGMDTALPPALFLGKRIQDVMPDLAPSVMPLVEKALEIGEMQTLEYPLFKHGVREYYEARILVNGPDEVLALVREITDKHRAQEEQRRLEEEILRMREAMVLDLSTPLIPISDEIMVMPIIGAMSEQRAQKLTEKLLGGIAEYRAAVAILDVTGMSEMTTETVGALTRAAQAARLLGARVLLTGIRPSAAQTMVTLGMDLSGIITLATLKAGIAFAMGRHRS